MLHEAQARFAQRLWRPDELFLSGGAYHAKSNGAGLIGPALFVASGVRARVAKKSRRGFGRPDQGGMAAPE
jgi:hypothetical protein